MARLRRVIEHTAGGEVTTPIDETGGAPYPDGQYFTDDATVNAYYTNDLKSNNYVTKD